MRSAKGFSLGKHISVLFERSSGLELLQQKNNDGSLHQSEMPAFHDKLQTSSAIVLFVASYYITYFLNNVRSDEHSSINIDFGGIPEVKLSRPSQAVQCAMYYYAAYLERSGVVKTDLELLKITLLFFERLMEEVLMRKASLKDADFFTSQNYKLEHSDFTVQGFEVAYTAQVKGVEFNATRMEDIVANEQAKHMFRRFAERLLCYDLNEQKNPMLVLGGMPSITMADGKPGTGKEHAHRGCRDHVARAVRSVEVALPLLAFAGEHHLHLPRRLSGTRHRMVPSDAGYRQDRLRADRRCRE